MRIMIDTNILISSSISVKGPTAKAYERALSEPFHPVVCDYALLEMRKVYIRKFPNKMRSLERFLSHLAVFVEIVRTPVDVYPGEESIRDVKDRPIFRAAIEAKCDYVLTGDKDFLESGIACPRMITASELLAMDIGEI